ncbi:zinc finger CW-type PWWP domain protein 1 isoform X2 [Rhinatrema bivittatum]|uniref:zinc finger CW-type PWWP domain protein 1 isoform X2 n=1 Tax=Rhinatrema bivittatum TaxID=194408 RepID=UPI001127C3F4|nr:zinc finger CW-type PWWP domain protein 1 isoform X2 [Rhinatrema bivittatum]
MATLKNKEECRKVTKKKFISPGSKPLTSPSTDSPSKSRGKWGAARPLGGKDILKASQKAEEQEPGAKLEEEEEEEKMPGMTQKQRETEKLEGTTQNTDNKENIKRAELGRRKKESRKTEKEKCYITDLQYQELFQCVLQKSLEECLEDCKKIRHQAGPVHSNEEEAKKRVCSKLPLVGIEAVSKKLSLGYASAAEAATVIAPKLQQEEHCLVGQKTSKLSLSKKRNKKNEGSKVECKRSRKGQPKKIVPGYTQITDQEEADECLNQCIAWVQCSLENCQKWRRLETSLDPSSLPENWSCSENLDVKYNSCDVPEETWSGSEPDVIYATFIPGSIVWAKQYGYPWWPGMVESDPDIGDYFLFTSQLDQLPSKYHITFLGDCVSRAWIPTSMLKNFNEMSTDDTGLKKVKNKDYSPALDAAIKMAKEAEKLNIQERISKFGFSGRFQQDAGTPQSIEDPGDSDDASDSASERDGRKMCEDHFLETELVFLKMENTKPLKKKVELKVTALLPLHTDGSHPVPKKVKKEDWLSEENKMIAFRSKKAEREQHSQIRSGCKKKFLSPRNKNRSSPERPSSLQHAKEIAEVPACDKMCPGADTDFHGTELAHHMNVARGRSVSACIEDDSFDDLLKEVAASQKELEEVFGSDDLNILTGKEGESQDDDFSMLLYEE